MTNLALAIIITICVQLVVLLLCLLCIHHPSHGPSDGSDLEGIACVFTAPNHAAAADPPGSRNDASRVGDVADAIPHVFEYVHGGSAHDSQCELSDITAADGPCTRVGQPLSSSALGAAPSVGTLRAYYERWGSGSDNETEEPVQHSIP